MEDKSIIKAELLRQLGIVDKEELMYDEYSKLLEQYPTLPELIALITKYKKLKDDAPKPPPDLSQQIQQTQQSISELLQKIDNLQQQISNLDNILLSITPSDATQQLLLAIATQNKTLLQDKIDALQEQVDSLQKQLANLQQRQQESTQKYEAELTAYNDTINKLKIDIQNMASALGITIPEGVL